MGIRRVVIDFPYRPKRIIDVKDKSEASSVGVECQLRVYGMASRAARVLGLSETSIKCSSSVSVK